jgi:ABC-2 type transport system permease protein
MRVDEGMTGTPAGAFSPRPGAAPLPRRIRAQTGMELRLTLRRGESVLLTLVIPVLMLIGLSTVKVIDVDGVRIDFFTPGILALAIMSTAFTGQAIATGYERQYGVLKRLGATPLTRTGLLWAKTAAVVILELGQLAILSVVAMLLGWSPHGSPLAVAALVLLGTAAFSALGLLLAGTLRAEATLAAANLIWFLFLVSGGVLFPLSRFSSGVRHTLGWLPLPALADGLRSVLQHGSTLPGHDLAVLALWSAVLIPAAASTFRWE